MGQNALIDCLRCTYPFVEIFGGSGASEARGSGFGTNLARNLALSLRFAVFVCLCIYTGTPATRHIWPCLEHGSRGSQWNTTVTSRAQPKPEPVRCLETAGHRAQPRTAKAARYYRAALQSPTLITHLGTTVDRSLGDLRGLRAPIRPNTNHELSFFLLGCERADWMCNVANRSPVDL